MAQRKHDGRSALEPDLVYVPVEEVVADAFRANGARTGQSSFPGALMKFGMAIVRLTPMPLLRLAEPLDREAGLDSGLQRSVAVAS